MVFGACVFAFFFQLGIARAQRSFTHTNCTNDRQLLSTNSRLMPTTWKHIFTFFESTLLFFAICTDVQCPCPHIVAKHSQLNRRAKKKPAQTKQPKWNETKSNGNTHLIKYALIIIASCCWVIMAACKGKKKIVLAICYFTEAFRKPHHFDGSRKLLKKTIQWYFFIYFFNGCNYFQLQAFVKFQLRPSSIWF